MFKHALLIAVALSFPACHDAVGQNPPSQPSARFVTARDSLAYSKSEGISVTADSSAVHNAFAISDATSIERRVFDKTNEIRVGSGLTPLQWDADLCRMARVHSEQMARLGFFSHETPDGLRLKDRARAAGILQFRVLGENIAYNKVFEDPGGFAVERWMASQLHRANILDAAFGASGIGSFVSPDASVHLTQVFLAR